MRKNVKIADLKKGDCFMFNHENFTVKQKFSKWKLTDEPFLKTTNGEIFYHDELEVKLCKPKT